MSINPDATVFLVSGFFAVLTTVLFGTLPAWRAGAADPGNLLKSRTAGRAPVSPILPPGNAPPGAASGSVTGGLPSGAGERRSAASSCCAISARL